MEGAGCLLAVNELRWTVTHFGSAWVVDTLQGKSSTSMGFSKCVPGPAGHVYLVTALQGSVRL